MALTEVVIALPPLRIEEVVRRPVIVLERRPHDQLVIERDGVADVQILDRLAHIIGIAFEGEFRGMDADHHQSIVGIGVVPGAHIGNGADAIDAAVGPEVDEHDLALELLAGQSGAVDPRAERVERRQLAFNRQLQPSAYADLRIGGLRPAKTQLLRQTGFERRRLGARQLGQNARVEA